MKLLAHAFLPALLLAPACRSSAAPEPTETAASVRDAGPAGITRVELTLEQQDARRLAERVAVLLADTGARIDAPDEHTWVVSGPESDVQLVRMLARAYDSPTLTPEHVARVYDLEHADGRQLASSARGVPGWGSTWIVLATPGDRWYAMVPRDELARFEELLAVLDRS